MQSTLKPFSSAILTELATGWLLDNSLCALELVEGGRCGPNGPSRPQGTSKSYDPQGPVGPCETVSRAQFLELASGAHALFMLVTLQCRECDRTRDCVALWRTLVELYEKGEVAWEGVGARESEVSAYLSILERLEQLTRDRVELYSENGWEREVLVSRKAW